VQHALAREHGHDGWIALKAALATTPDAGVVIPKARTAAEYDIWPTTSSSSSIHRIRRRSTASTRTYQRAFTFDDWWAEIWRRVYAFRQRSSKVPKNYLQLAEAEMLIAQDVGFASWSALTKALATGAARMPAYGIDAQDNSIAPRRTLNDAEWDELIAVMRDRRITSLNAIGLMTDGVLSRIAALDHVTALSLGGSRELTDDGLLHLARMPQLTHLNLSEYPGGKLTDRGLAVLWHLPNLRSFEMTWQRGITDAGVSHLRFCDQLERVDLMGSPTGDGAIEALQGKPRLRYFSTGRLVTDEGVRLLHNFPTFKAWRQGERECHLLIDGPFTNDGLASLAGLEGVEELDLFWHVTGITSNGFAHLAALPNLMSLGADGELSDKRVNAPHGGHAAAAQAARAERGGER
jgi:hypothetical protein